MSHIIKPEWKNPTRGVQTKDVIKNYFAQLSKSQIKDLYEMFRYVLSQEDNETYRYTCDNKMVILILYFRYDFVLFDYSPDEYIALGRDENTVLICKE